MTNNLIDISPPVKGWRVKAVEGHWYAVEDERGLFHKAKAVRNPWDYSMHLALDPGDEVFGYYRVLNYI